jgi:hypothetical protein
MQPPAARVRRCGALVMKMGTALMLAASMLMTLLGAARAKQMNGADYATVDQSVDAPGHCQNGDSSINCNIHDGSRTSG